MYTLVAIMIDTEVKKAAEVIRTGGIILYPTDTIWGIGCDATNPKSVQRIYRIKQRADSKSMLVLVSGIPMLEEYLEKIPPQALEMIRQADKPTTIIYPGALNLADNLLAPDKSIGIRIVSDPFCKKLINSTGKPVVSTSANISGKQPPARFSEICPEIREQVDYVVSWRQDETATSTPSTIIKLEQDGSVTRLR
jgi:L-threonylcarbamoyladenylate synthase